MCCNQYVAMGLLMEPCPSKFAAVHILFSNGGSRMDRACVRQVHWRAIRIMHHDKQSTHSAAVVPAQMYAVLVPPGENLAPHVCFSRGVGPVEFWMLEPV